MQSHSLASPAQAVSLTVVRLTGQRSVRLTGTTPVRLTQSEVPSVKLTAKRSQADASAVVSLGARGTQRHGDSSVPVNLIVIRRSVNLTDSVPVRLTQSEVPSVKLTA